MTSKDAKPHRWKLPFLRSKSKAKREKAEVNPPKEFLCPISGALMHDPVVLIPTGQTFDRVSTQVYRDLNYTLTLPNQTTIHNFNSVIPNLTLKTTIHNWCTSHNLPSSPPDYTSLKTTILNLHSSAPDKLRVSERDLIRAVPDKPTPMISHAETEIGPCRFYANSSHSSSEESVIVGTSPPMTPLPFTTRPSCYSSSCSSEIEVIGERERDAEEDEIVRKMKSGEVFEQEDGVILLRKITRVREESRVKLCTLRVLDGVKELMLSRYNVVSTNAVAGLVNLSLERCNKLKIVRAGVVPVLVDVLKGGRIEAQEHAAGALFSLAIEDENKTAIGVLGALQPLMYALRSESERASNDSALALYHLSLVRSNQVKLVKLGAVVTLLDMVRSLGVNGLVSRVLLVLCNLAICEEGRSVMLDANGVECFVGMLKRGEFDTESTRENCVAALYALSHGSMRFKGLAKETGAVEVLKEIEESGTERAREKARRILQSMKGREDGEDGQDVDWEGILESGEFSRTRSRVGRARNGNGTFSNNF